ncbi:MAG: hypothetical protein WA990_09980 [Rubrobacteraceae bacterium]
MAEEPLLVLEESWVFGMLWPKRLLIFEDRIEARSTELLQETIETTYYSEIKDVAAGGGGWSVSLLIKRNGSPMLLRGVEEAAAEHAKTLIKDRIHRTPKGNLDAADLTRKPGDLRDAGILSDEEYQSKQRAIDEADPSI